MPSEKYTVLIVDDSATFRMRISYILLDCNLYPVLQANNYDEAYNWLVETKIDLVLLDIGLPGKSGIELLKLIKKNYPGTKVIMVSNYVNDYYIQYCQLHGAHSFFDKSLDFEKMERMMQQISEEEMKIQN